MVESYSTGIGGDCFILYHEAAGSGELHAINGSGRAPLQASAEAIRARGYTAMPEQGILPVTVPGAVDAWHSAHRALGALDFAELLQPAIDYAERGYVVSPIIAHNWRNSEALLAQTAEASAAYLVAGRAPAAGEVHRQPNLARSLRAIAAQGRDAFYCGELAEAMVAFSQRCGGLLSLEDFARHRTAVGHAHPEMNTAATKFVRYRRTARASRC